MTAHHPRTLPKPDGWLFDYGDPVRKHKGSSWHGTVVGFYTSSLTPEGYCVESEREPGSVQVYPVAALTRSSEE